MLPLLGITIWGTWEEMGWERDRTGRTGPASLDPELSQVGSSDTEVLTPVLGK